MRLPSGEKATQFICFSHLNCHNCLPVFTSHTRTLLSFSKKWPLPEAIVRPSGEKPTQLTLAECPLSGHLTSNVTGNSMAAPVAESQNLMVLSQLHDTMVLPVGSKQTPVTRSVWPVIVDNRPPSSKFHSLMLLSSEQEATTLSSGWNATPVTVLPDSDRQQPSLTHRHTDTQWNSKHGCVLGHDRNNQS